MIIKFPWSIDNGIVEYKKQENTWILTALSERDIPYHFLKMPDKKTEDRISKILEFLLGQRKMVCVLSNDSSSNNILMYYITVTWPFTFGRMADMVHTYSIENDGFEIVSRWEQSSLLIFPYSSPDDYNIRKYKNVLGNLIMRRNVKRVPTLIDVFTKDDPTKLTKDEMTRTLNRIASIYGDHCLSLFSNTNSNMKKILIKG